MKVIHSDLIENTKRAKNSKIIALGKATVTQFRALPIQPTDQFDGV